MKFPGKGLCKFTLKTNDMLTQFRLFIWLSFLLSFLVLPPAFACLCGPISPMQALARSSVVFEGEILDLRTGSIFLNLSYRVENAWPISVRDTTNTSSVIFLRNVKEIDSIGLSSSADPVAATIRVSKIWKGASCDTLIIHTVRSEVSCGVEFRKGQEYLIYASGSKDHLTTDLCSRTKRVDQAEMDLSILKQFLGTPLYINHSDTTSIEDEMDR